MIDVGAAIARVTVGYWPGQTWCDGRHGRYRFGIHGVFVSPWMPSAWIFRAAGLSRTQADELVREIIASHERRQP